ncbi:MAG: VWA domain-containing protein [Pseudomonadota bacterium]
MTAPKEIGPLLAFATALRRAAFPVAPDQTIGFLQAVELLGPRGIEDIRQAGLALFAIPPQRVAEYDAVFRAVFFGQTIAAPAGTTEDDTDVMEVTGAEDQAEIADDTRESGPEASRSDAEGTRLIGVSEDAALARFSAEARTRLPRRKVIRREKARSGDRLDLRRSMRSAARFDGDVTSLTYRRRKSRQRRIVFLIDVSGSMQDHSAPALRMAHKLVQSVDHAEAFSIGTRLTRLTPALKLKAEGAALARASTAITDFDRGTRLGDALWAYLGVPRYASLARGAWVVVFSDGLERDRPERLEAATDRLARMAWRVTWLTPLGAPGRFNPETEGLKAIAPHLDALEGAPDLAALTAHLLTYRPGPTVPTGPSQF